MRADEFIDAIGCDYYAGVPDSLLRPFCDCLFERYGVNPARHVVAANEGNAVALTAGYHLATGRIGCVYMQNSGQGNAVNPLASLTSPDVYAIPMVLVIGWRGEPGVADEPQHVQQGRITLELLNALGIRYLVVGQTTTPADIAGYMRSFQSDFDSGHSVAFVVRKGAFESHEIAYANSYSLAREDAIRLVLKAAGNNPVVCTTGKASRELFEIREAHGQGHGQDFLTVGSMGHASSIAMGLASQLPNRQVWCLDGDGAALMHMGAMGIIGTSGLDNFVHVVVNNNAHESVGGMPTVASMLELPAVARACGYHMATAVGDLMALEQVLAEISSIRGPVLIEIKCAIGSRANLGRPTTSPKANKQAFMEMLLRS